MRFLVCLLQQFSGGHVGNFQALAGGALAAQGGKMLFEMIKGKNHHGQDSE